MSEIEEVLELVRSGRYTGEVVADRDQTLPGWVRDGHKIVFVLAGDFNDEAPIAMRVICPNTPGLMCGDTTPVCVEGQEDEPDLDDTGQPYCRIRQILECVDDVSFNWEDYLLSNAQEDLSLGQEFYVQWQPRFYTAPDDERELTYQLMIYWPDGDEPVTAKQAASMRRLRDQIDECMNAPEDQRG